LPPAGLSARAADLPPRDGVDRGERAHQEPQGIDRDGAPHPPRVAALSAVSRAPPALGRRSRPPSATLQLPEREGRSATQPEPEARLAEPTLQPHAIPVGAPQVDIGIGAQRIAVALEIEPGQGDRKSTRLNSSHVAISYAVFCLKKKKKKEVKEI